MLSQSIDPADRHRSRCWTSAAKALARRDLPIPPGPAMVTIAPEATVLRSVASSSWRPNNGPSRRRSVGRSGFVPRTVRCKSMVSRSGVRCRARSPRCAPTVLVGTERCGPSDPPRAPAERRSSCRCVLLGERVVLDGATREIDGLGEATEGRRGTCRRRPAGRGCAPSRHVCGSPSSTRRRDQAAAGWSRCSSASVVMSSIAASGSPLGQRSSSAASEQTDGGRAHRPCSWSLGDSRLDVVSTTTLPLAPIESRRWRSLATMLRSACFQLVGGASSQTMSASRSTVTGPVGQRQGGEDSDGRAEHRWRMRLPSLTTATSPSSRISTTSIVSVAPLSERRVPCQRG